jgi:hypothetical protein
VIGWLHGPNSECGVWVLLACPYLCVGYWWYGDCSLLSHPVTPCPCPVPAGSQAQLCPLAVVLACAVAHCFPPAPQAVGWCTAARGRRKQQPGCSAQTL